MRALTLAVVSCLFAAGGSASGENDPEVPVVSALIENVETAIEEAEFEPVSERIIAARRAWLFRTLDRLEEFIDEHSDRPEVAGWREQIRLKQFRQELLKDSPNTGWLGQLKNEDFFVRFREAGDEKEPDKDAIEPDDLGYPVVASFIRAFIRYFEVLDDHQAPKQGQVKLEHRLTELRDYLVKYLRNDDLAARRTLLKSIHSVVNDIEDSLQAQTLTSCVRERYLQPKIRVFVSTRTLSHLLNLFPLPSQPVHQRQNGTYVQGVATPIGRLRVTGFENDKIGVFDARYVGPVVFNGSASRRRIQLGISARLAADVNKRFFAIEEVPDSAPAGSHVALVSTGSSGGCLVDHIVDRSARRTFDAGNISAMLEEDINDRVTQAANLIDFGVVKTLEEKLREAGPDITRMRSYRSRENGIELTLLSAQGFREPDCGPPHFFGPDARHIDFAVSLRKGLSRDLLGVIFPKDPARLSDVASTLIQAFEFADDRELETDSLMIKFPEDKPFVTFAEGKIAVEFLVEEKDAAQVSRNGTIELEYRSVDGGLDLAPRLVTDDPALEQKLGPFFRRFARLERIRLPSLNESSRDAQSVGGITNLRLDPGDPYVTLSGELDLP